MFLYAGLENLELENYRLAKSNLETFLKIWEPAPESLKQKKMAREALKKINIRNVDLIMNLQGDEPAINVEDIISLNQKMINTQAKMGTLASKIKDLKDLENENIVKVITKKDLENNEFSEAETFLRKISNVGNIYHHIGIYCYSAEALESFVKLSQSQNEIKYRLEQLRALDNNINIKVALAKSTPIGVDTEEDYLALKKIMEYKN